MATKAEHFLLYVALIIMPLPGVLTDKCLLNLFQLAQVGPLDLPEAFEAFAGGTHVTIQYLFFALTPSHAAAAI